MVSRAQCYIPTSHMTPREMFEFRDRAVAAWLTTARKCGSPYTDRIALAMVRDQAIEALRFEDMETVIRAIEQRMDHRSSPRRIPYWARAQGSDERALLHNELEMREREERERIVEYEGTLYIGHVPHAVGDSCSECGRTLAEHRLAEKPQLRRINGTVGALVERLRP